MEKINQTNKTNQIKQTNQTLKDNDKINLLSDLFKNVILLNDHYDDTDKENIYIRDHNKKLFYNKNIKLYIFDRIVKLSYLRTLHIPIDATVIITNTKKQKLYNEIVKQTNDTFHKSKCIQILNPNV